MQGKRVRQRGVLAALLVSVLAASACGDSSSQGTAERIYVRSMNGDAMAIAGLNAQVAGGLNTKTFSAQILEPLIFISGGSELSPGLAESWELSDDGLELTLRLREGVTWHDGEPFTAEDVKFNYDEIIPMQVYGAQLFERITSVDIVDERTVVIRLSEAFGPLLETIATQFLIPQHLYEGTDYITNPANKEKIAGTGPMMFSSYTPGQEIVLVKNPNYWGGEVQVDKGVFTQIPDPNSRAEALFSGQIDEAILDPSKAARVSETDNMEILIDGFFPEAQVVSFNAQSEYLKDPEVRRAVFAAMDRHALVETALSGVGSPANGFFPENLDWAVNHDIDFDRDFPHDLDAINRTLEEAGFPRGPDGMRFTLRLQYLTSSPDTALMVELIASQLEEVGIASRLSGDASAVYTENTYRKGDFDLVFVRTSLGGEPSIGITRWYACNERRLESANPSGLCDLGIDAAVDAALVAPGQAARGEAYKALQERARDVMIHAPLVWSITGNPVINTSRWQGLDDPGPLVDRKPWLTMQPVE